MLCPFRAAKGIGIHLLGLLILVLAIQCGGGGGGGSKSHAFAIGYPQTSIVAPVGWAIAAVTPTVTETATSFSITPVLPAGMSLNGGSGAISGTPTAVTAQATYTVTASNSGKSATTTLQIAVVEAIAVFDEYQPAFANPLKGFRIDVGFKMPHEFGTVVRQYIK